MQDQPVGNQSNRSETSEEQRKELRREHHHDDRWRGLFWGLLLILLGVLFLGEQQHWFIQDTWWHYLLIGLGIIFLIDGGVRYAASGYRGSSYGRFVPGIILLFLGIAFVYGFDQWWPIALIAGGVILLLSLIFRRR